MLRAIFRSNWTKYTTNEETFWRDKGLSEDVENEKSQVHILPKQCVQQNVLWKEIIARDERHRTTLVKKFDETLTD